MKLIVYLLVAVFIALGWGAFLNIGSAKIKARNTEITRLEAGSQEDLEHAEKLRAEIADIQSGKSLLGVMLAIASAVLIGVVFVIDVLPIVVHRFTHVIYDSGEMVEKDPLHDARALYAQGDMEGAIEAFRKAADEHPLNRMPWVEIAKIQRVYLESPQDAADTLREAIEGQEWEVNDAAYLMFRLAEIYDEDLEDRASAEAIFNQVIEDFPETRHAANARSRLHEWASA